MNRIDADLRHKTILMAAGGAVDADSEDGGTYRNTLQAVRAHTKLLVPYVDFGEVAETENDTKALAEAYLETYGNQNND